MYKSASSSFFLGASSPKGFYSLFSELHSPKDGWRLYILKGGPGTGKSSFIKKIASESDKRGLYSERIYCSSDPESLDALILPHMKISICDGTPPHTAEPRYPGISEVLIDLGAYRNDRELRKNSEQIIKTADSASEFHKKATEFLFAASAVNADTGKIVLSALRPDRINRFAEKFASACIKGTSNVKGRRLKRFLSGYTPSGYVVFTDTFTDMCERRIVLKDNFGLASSLILKAMENKAAEQGFDCISCLNPMSPEFSVEHLIIPELSLGIFTSSRIHPCNFPADKTVDCMRFTDREQLMKHKNRIIFNNRSGDELILAALDNLSLAKSEHDRLEKLYIPHMDFDRVNIKNQEIIKEIFS